MFVLKYKLQFLTLTTVAAAPEEATLLHQLLQKGAGLVG